MNNGQLVKVIRDKFMIPAIPFTKIQGMPFAAGEILDKIEELLTKK
jgi:2-oxoglutarate ferredoxin oxidoreductase subunit alpha